MRALQNKQEHKDKLLTEIKQCSWTFRISLIVSVTVLNFYLNCYLKPASNYKIIPLQVTYTCSVLNSRAVKNLIFTKLFILWIKCETLEMVPKVFNNFDILIASLKATGHPNFNMAETHKQWYQLKEDQNLSKLH